MGVEQPWIYDHPTKYSFISPSEKSFNPRAATQASWTPRPPRPKPNGLLIESKEFNRHPDSYFVVPYGNLNAKPMSPRTKSKVKWTRMVQLFFRICALLGALGMLVCVICIRGTDVTTGWIIRVPVGLNAQVIWVLLTVLQPGIAILHTIYAIYHLARSSKGRTPASSASYMLFAAIMDAGLIPFYVFAAMVSHAEYIALDVTQNRWKTLFGEDGATDQVIHSTFLLGVVNGGLHLVSLVLSIYLGVIFRKISRLPPDMNPLEDNLTSRHKRNKSSLVDNRISQASTATTTSKEKTEESVVSPVRNVPFMHTRNSSHSNINNVPHPKSSPRASQPSIFEQPPNQPSLRRTSHTSFPNLNQEPPIQDENTQPEIKRSPTKTSSVYSRATDDAIRPHSTAPSLPDTNWITHPIPSPSPSPSPPRELNFLRNKAAYQPLSQGTLFEYTNENAPPLLPKPLEMNPPTPPIEQQKMKRGYRQLGNEGRVLTPRTGNWGPGAIEVGMVRQWGASGGGGDGGRVVSRSGVEIREEGIIPNGGVRAREVSGKVMEEGRGSGGNWR